MIREFWLVAAVVTALTAPGRAQDQCVAPKAPAIPDGARATANQIITAQSEIKAYAAASDNYQKCLAQELARQDALAKQNSTEPDPGLLSAVQVKSAAQMNDARRIATAWGAAVQAFNKAQQSKQRQPAPNAAPGGGGYGSGGYGGNMGGRY